MEKLPSALVTLRKKFAKNPALLGYWEDLKTGFLTWTLWIRLLRICKHAKIMEIILCLYMGIYAHTYMHTYIRVCTRARAHF